MDGISAGTIYAAVALKLQELYQGREEAVKVMAELDKEINAQMTTMAANAQKAWTEMTKQLGENLKTFGKNMNQIGGAMTKVFTVPLAGVGVGAAKAAVDFESAFAGVRKTVDATEEELAALKEGILDMATKVPASATAIASVAEAAGQLGIKNEAIMGFTKTMIDLGESTNLSADQAADSFARLANITQMPQDQFDRLGATIVALGNGLAATESEIVEMGMRIAGAGAQIGLSEAQILSIAGALSSVGIEAEAGGSAISRVMVDMAKGIEDGYAHLWAPIGMTGEQFEQLFKEDAAAALIAFIEGLDKMKKSGESVFQYLDSMKLDDIRVRDALLRASGAGDLFRQSIEIGAKAWEENIALTKEAEQRYGTTASQMTVFGNQLKDIGITLGETLLPVLQKLLEAAQPLIEHIKSAVEWFGNLDPKLQTAIITIGGVVTALGPMLLIAGQLVTSIGTLAPLLGGLPALFTAITGPVGLTVAAIAGLATLGALIYTHWDEIKEYLGKPAATL